MKKILSLILVILVGCSEPVNYQSLVKRDNLFYLQYELKPYTGKVFNNEFDINPDFDGFYIKLICFEGYIKKGQLHGYTKFYDIEYEDEPQKSKQNPESQFRSIPTLDELLEGRKKLENGKCTNKIYFEGRYKNGVPDGKWLEWDENGNLYVEWYYNDGNIERETFYEND